MFAAHRKFGVFFFFFFCFKGGSSPYSVGLQSRLRSGSFPTRGTLKMIPGRRYTQGSRTVEKLFFFLLVPFTHRRSGAAAAVVRNGDQVAPLSGTGVGVGGASSRLTAAQEHDRQGTKIDALAVWEKKKRRKASACIISLLFFSTTGKSIRMLPRYTASGESVLAVNVSVRP